MKLPIGLIARFALHKIVLPAISRAIQDGKNPLTKEAAKRALQDAVMQEMAGRVERGVA